MTPKELGTALTEARIARGLSLLDVERDTRISRKYLQALEEGNLEVLPAPVYARAFTRTYAQYLGLNAPSLVQTLPGAKPEPELPPLPQVGREAKPAISASWMVAGVVVVLMFGLGLLLFWDRGGSDVSVTSGLPPNGTTLGSDQPTPPVQQPLIVEPGVVPNLLSQPLQAALSALDEAQLPYLVIEVTNADSALGQVFQQSPPAGTEADDATVVTLMVSR